MKILKVQNSNLNPHSGFSLVEALLAMAIFAMVVFSTSTAMTYGQQDQTLAGSQSRATYLAEEGLEAVRNIRDNNFFSLVDGNHGLAISANTWTFSGTSDTNGIFTRQIIISSIDSQTKKIESKVNWQQNAQRIGQVLLTTYLTNWPGFTTTPDWRTPKFVSSLDLAGTNDALKIKVVGNYAYIIVNGTNPGFVIVNISNPAAPTLAGQLNLSSAPTNISVSGNYAYLTTSNRTQELQIINITNPSSPSLVGTFDLSGNSAARGIFVSGTYAYIVQSTQGKNPEFNIVNVSNPASPTLAGSMRLNANGNEIIVIGSYAYVASSHDSQELQIINITNPAAPTLIGSYDASGTSDAITITGFGSTICLGRADGSIYLIDVTNPASPTLLGTYNAGASVNDLTLGKSNTYLFAATSNSTSEFLLLNITTPSTPTLLSSYDLTDIAYGIGYSDTLDRAFLATAIDSQELVVIGPT